MSRSPYRDALVPQRLALAVRRDRLEATAAALEAADELSDEECERLRTIRRVLNRPVTSLADLDAVQAALAELDHIVRRPRAHKPRWAIPAAVVGMAFALPFAPLSIDVAHRWRHWNDACGRSIACERAGLCARTVLAALSDDDRVACRASSSRDCTKSDACGREGRCTAVGGVCRAASNEDCRGSSSCTVGGRCVAADGRCVRR